MQEIIHAFGIDWKLIVIQMVNFGILAGLLWYFLYTPVLNILRDRQTKIEQGVRDAEAAHEAVKVAETERARVLTGAQHEAGAIVERAHHHAEQRSAEIIKDAENKATRILHDAGVKGDEIKLQAAKESESEVAKIAILAAEKILNERL